MAMLQILNFAESIHSNVYTHMALGVLLTLRLLTQSVKLHGLGKEHQACVFTIH